MDNLKYRIVPEKELEYVHYKSEHETFSKAKEAADNLCFDTRERVHIFKLLAIYTPKVTHTSEYIPLDPEAEQ